MRWHEISKDPNAPEVLQHRVNELKAMRAAPVEDRVAYMKSLAAGKRVLDIGVVDHRIGQQHSPDWLHGNIASAASSILGVDILPEAIEQLQKEGYNVRLWDVTEKPLDEQFEVITVGEVIEHLGSPANLLRSAKKMLVPGGRLVLTTPNPYYLSRIRDSLFRGVGPESADHVTLLFPSGLAEMAEREGLRLDRWRGVKVIAPSTRGRFVLGAMKILPFSAESFCNTLIYEFVNPAS